MSCGIQHHLPSALARKNDHGHLEVKFCATRDHMKSILSASVKRPGHTAVRQVAYNNLKYLDLRIRSFHHMDMLVPRFGDRRFSLQLETGPQGR